jgi:hypothetical protein
MRETEENWRREPSSEAPQGQERRWALASPAEIGAVAAFCEFAAALVWGLRLRERALRQPSRTERGWACAFGEREEPGCHVRLDSGGRVLAAAWGEPDAERWHALSRWAARAFGGQGAWAVDEEGPDGLVEAGWRALRERGDDFWAVEALFAGERDEARARALAMVSASLDTPMPASCLSVASGGRVRHGRERARWAVEQAAKLAEAAGSDRALAAFERAGFQRPEGGRSATDARSFLGI